MSVVPEVPVDAVVMAALVDGDANLGLVASVTAVGALGGMIAALAALQVLRGHPVGAVVIGDLCPAPLMADDVDLGAGAEGGFGVVLCARTRACIEVDAVLDPVGGG